MRLPRFRLRTMMVGVVIVAVILAAEITAIPLAIELVSESDGNGKMTYIAGEAIAVWTIMHVIFLGPMYLIVRDVRKRYREIADTTQARRVGR